MNGIDISGYQKGIDIASLKGVDFVIIKATEGTGWVDDQCDVHYQKAKASGKRLGVYHFARPTMNSAIAEADYFVNNIQGYIGDALLALDWEDTDKSNVAWAKQWLDRVYERTGVRPLIYMNPWVTNAYDWRSVVAGDYGLWVAQYRDYLPDVNFDMTNSGEEPKISHWNFYALWQWTSSGRIDGYNGNLDLDIFYGDTAAWDRYAGKQTTAPVTEVTPPTPQVNPLQIEVDRLNSEVMYFKDRAVTLEQDKQRLQDTILSLKTQLANVVIPADLSGEVERLNAEITRLKEESSSFQAQLNGCLGEKKTLSEKLQSVSKHLLPAATASIILTYLLSPLNLPAEFNVALQGTIVYGINMLTVYLTDNKTKLIEVVE